MQGISRQTLLFYDKIGLFKPSFVDTNGYRYYDAKKLDVLDTICIMKDLGMSLKAIKDFLVSYDIDKTIASLKSQSTIIDKKIDELRLKKERIEAKVLKLKEIAYKDDLDTIKVIHQPEMYLYLEEVKEPNDLEAISIATKACFTKALKKGFEVYLQSGVIVPYKRIIEGHYIEASFAFLPLKREVDNTMVIKEGDCIEAYHLGDYLSIGKTYEKILKYCKDHELEIVSDSYEFALNDYLSTSLEKDYVTKIIFYVKSGK